MKLHHAALRVTDIDEAIRWYSDVIGATVTYQDKTWAMLDIENTSLALVTPSEHPPHLAFEHPSADQFGILTDHRDGTASIYIDDPFGNTIEFLKSPEVIKPA